MSSKAIILIQAIDEPLQVSFNYALAQSLQELEGHDFFSCDSLSDQSVAYYLKEMIREKEEVYLVFDTRLTTHIGMGQSLLNSFIKSEKIHLICLGDPGKLTPFMKLFQGKAFGSEAELLAYFSSN